MRYRLLSVIMVVAVNLVLFTICFICAYAAGSSLGICTRTVKAYSTGSASSSRRPLRVELLAFRGAGVLVVFPGAVRFALVSFPGRTITVIKSLEMFRYALMSASSIACSSDAVKAPTVIRRVPDTFMYTACVCAHVSFENSKPGLHAQLPWFCFAVAENGHVEHCAAAARENVLPLQAMHVPSPSVSLYVPDAHPTQFPSVPVYPLPHTKKQNVLFSPEIMPSMHGRHCPSPVVVKLALQKHELLPGTDVLVLLHASHAAAPVAFLYVPTAHALHGPPPGPLVPGGHMQFAL